MKNLSLTKRLVVTAALLTAMVACGAHSEDSGDATDLGHPVPYLQMTGPLSGFALWPSGSAWVVLATSDDWRTVQNRTPLGVPTEGGLVLAARSGNVAVGVLPHELLTSSAVLRSVTAGQTWIPTQLPGALSSSPGALALSKASTWAVLANGSVQAVGAGTAQWRSVTSSRQLDTTGPLVLTGITFPDDATGFVTGRGPASSPVLFSTSDGGHTWRPVPLPLGTDKGPATAYPPCRTGGTWLMPVRWAGTLRVFRSPDLLGPWTESPPLASSAPPVVACGPGELWVATTDEGSAALYLLTPGQGWNRRGAVPDGIVSLSVSGAGQGFATLENAETILSVTPAGPALTTRLPLPDWVASLGGEPARD